MARPSFFHGFATHPQVLARGLVTLADVTATRYFECVPANLRDPVLTAHGDRLRAECFSACNRFYARLDLLGSGLDGGEIGRGATNVDTSAETRRLLSGIGRSALLHVDVGDDGLRVATPEETALERPVEMPDRWVRALGNAAEPWRGFSGEGSLLTSLASPQAADDADLLSALLAFEPVVDVPRLGREAALDESRVAAALAVLATPAVPPMPPALAAAVAVFTELGWADADITSVLDLPLGTTEQQATAHTPRFVRRVGRYAACDAPSPAN
ncbi:MAG TPA: hypothetical protein VGE77_12680 [Nocardioides sp.]